MNLIWLNEFRELDSRLHHLNDQQNIYWRQRAKQHWLLHGDMNTKFFHSYATTRKRKNAISKLRNMHGQWVEGDGLLSLAVECFSDIFTSRGTGEMRSLDNLTSKVTAEDNLKLLQRNLLLLKR